MDLLEMRADGNEQMLASGLTPGEVDELLDWWRYTKPLGSGVKIVVKDRTGSSLGVSTTGTDPDPLLSGSISSGVERALSENFIG